MKQLEYSTLLDLDRLREVFFSIKNNSRHKDKIFAYEMFLTANLIGIKTILQERAYVHGKYNIFLIHRPKSRVIMSESMTDKIINHLVSRYCLFPLIEPKLIDMNVATREGKGSKAALFYVKKYLHHLKENHKHIYVLKCDIHKYFYSIDHEILLSKLSHLIMDEEVFRLVKTIIDSTNLDYVNQELANIIKRRKQYIYHSNINEREKIEHLARLAKIPFYEKGKGLPIGNMTSQILAIFYLNDLDHYIKEKLGVQCYIRYMDDLILIHYDSNYLKKCLHEIEKQVHDLRLSLNEKTQIYEVTNQGFPFLGYRFVLRKKRLHVLLLSNTKRRILRRLKKVADNQKYDFLHQNYFGYLLPADSRGFLYEMKKKRLR